MSKLTQWLSLQIYLKNEMMTQKELSLRIDISEKHISNIIKWKVKISENISLKLRYVFWTDPFYFSWLDFIKKLD
jgi:plasmid maintenance system antidote protein VapI